MGLEPERPPLGGRHFEVAIVGGGINGVAIARECARTGRRVLLVEQNDFASGTTSRSTRIIHGGLRYLEHGEIGLVRESLRERQRLSAERPHLVRPMEFVLAIPRARRNSLEIRLGLWLYRRFAGAGRRTPGDLKRFESSLNGNRASLHVFRYEDAQCEFPERLVAAWLREAMHAGAVVRNHTRVLAVQITSGRVRGLTLRDELTGTEYEVNAGRVVNAAGPWVDSVCGRSGIRTEKPLVGGVRGSHIVIPRFDGAPQTAVYTEATDGRPVFLIPWNGQLLFGTTEISDCGDPALVRPSDGEISYLVQSLRGMWPKANIDQISFAMAGVRPLPYVGAKDASSITRRHFLHDHADEGAGGLISVIGGKLTTAASLAHDCARKLGMVVGEPAPALGFADSGAFEAMLDQFAIDVSSTAAIDRRTARALVSWHGGDAIWVARTMASNPRLRRPIVDGMVRPVGEAVFAVRHESAVTLSDILLRRVPMALSREWSFEATQDAARHIGSCVGWTDVRINAEVEAFESERSAFLVRPAGVRIAA